MNYLCVLLIPQHEDFEQQILEAAKSFASATKNLITSASAVKKDEGKIEGHQWREGLVSAVSASMSKLVLSTS